MNEITVQVPVKHDGKWYEPGDTITGLSTEEFNRLKELNANAVVDNTKNNWNQFDEVPVTVSAATKRTDIAGDRAKNGFVRH